jgi:hypothetical protein
VHRGKAEKNLRKIEAFTAETLRTQRKAGEILRFAQDVDAVASSELVGFLGVAETWEGVGWAFAVHFYFYGAFGFGAGLTEDGEGG